MPETEIRTDNPKPEFLLQTSSNMGCQRVREGDRMEFMLIHRFGGGAGARIISGGASGDKRREFGAAGCRGGCAHGGGPHLWHGASSRPPPVPLRAAAASVRGGLRSSAVHRGAVGGGASGRAGRGRRAVLCVRRPPSGPLPCAARRADEGRAGGASAPARAPSGPPAAGMQVSAEQIRDGDERAESADEGRRGREARRRRCAAAAYGHRAAGLGCLGAWRPSESGAGGIAAALRRRGVTGRGGTGGEGVTGEE